MPETSAQQRSLEVVAPQELGRRDLRDESVSVDPGRPMERDLNRVVNVELHLLSLGRALRSCDVTHHCDCAMSCVCWDVGPLWLWP
jgi:hypothetical protein